MTKSIRTGVFLLSLQAATACGPTAPSPLAPPAPTPPAAPGAAPGAQAVSIQIRGTVRDSMLEPLAGVYVDSWTGPEGGALSDSNGEFVIVLHGTFLADPFVGTDKFHASKAGYVSEIRTLESGLNFVLRPASALAKDKGSM
jgi:protocatechuate 3,4-dioxygenase beta subunit